MSCQSTWTRRSHVCISTGWVHPCVTPILIEPEVEAALRDGRPVVALETAVLTHGLPRTPAPAIRAAGGEGWDPAGAVNLETALAMQRSVRAGGASTNPVCGSLRKVSSASKRRRSNPFSRARAGSPVGRPMILGRPCLPPTSPMGRGPGRRPNAGP